MHVYTWVTTTEIWPPLVLSLLVTQQIQTIPATITIKLFSDPINEKGIDYYLPIFALNNVNNKIIVNILITTKLLQSSWLLLSYNLNIEKIECTCKEWAG